MLSAGARSCFVPFRAASEAPIVAFFLADDAVKFVALLPLRTPFSAAPFRRVAFAVSDGCEAGKMEEKRLENCDRTLEEEEEEEAEKKRSNHGEEVATEGLKARKAVAATKAKRKPYAKILTRRPLPTPPNTACKSATKPPPPPTLPTKWYLCGPSAMATDQAERATPLQSETATRRKTILKKTKKKRVR